MRHNSGSVILAWAVWGVLLAAWTVALLRPVPPAVHAVVPGSLRFWAAKALHVGAFAALAFAVCWLPAWRGARPAAWALLLAHAAVTEFFQNFVGRDGNPTDVAINAAGVAAGVTAGLALRRLLAPPP